MSDELADADNFEAEERRQFLERPCDVADTHRTMMRRAMFVPPRNEFASAARETVAVQAVLHAIRGGLDIPLSEGLVREAELFGHLCATPEKRKALQAFIEKRQAKMSATQA